MNGKCPICHKAISLGFKEIMETPTEEILSLVIDPEWGLMHKKCQATISSKND